MSRARGGLPGALALAGTAAATTWFTLLSWRGFTEQSARFLGPLLVLGAVIAVSGAVGRWARLPGAVVFLGQAALAGMLACTMLVGAPLPLGPARGRLTALLEEATSVAQRYEAPVPSSAAEGGVQPWLVLGGLVCLLLVDLLACTLRRVPLAGLPLLTIYSVPVSMLVDGVSWWIFTLAAAGFLLMLFLQVNEQVARWGRPLGIDGAPGQEAFGVRTGAVRVTAAAVGATATAVAVLLPIVIPTLDLNLLEGGIGPGGGDLTIENPMVDLRRDLQRGEDVPLVRVRTDDPRPEYLRIAVLNRFSDNEWSSGDRDVPTHQLASGPVPDLQGVAGTVPRTEYRYDVDVEPSFESRWLPTQAPITAIRAAGDWRYDERTMDFISGEDDLTTAGLSYSMTSVELDMSVESMALAPSSGGQVSTDYLELPDGIPPEITNLAFQVTRHDETRFEKAQTLQQWFREDGGFTYDLDVEEGNGTDDLLRFLTEGEDGRTGYCEQFAAAMAVLARTVGIPSRVAVGFLQPQRVGQDEWEYSAWDMHSWPELFFPGSGWVRFEPTPAGRAESAPGYTTARVPQPEDSDGPGGPRPDEELPDRDESDGASPSEDDVTAADGAQDDGSVPWLTLVAVMAGAAAVGWLLLLPRLVRRSRTRRRLGAGPEPAWAELRDTALDLGVPWPEGRSPRETADQLVEHLGLPLDDQTSERPRHGADVAPDAVHALDIIVLALERLRYAPRTGAGVPALTAELQTVAASLHGGASERRRRRATWWPASVVGRGRRTSRVEPEAPAYAQRGGVVDHVG